MTYPCNVCGGESWKSCDGNILCKGCMEEPATHRVIFTGGAQSCLCNYCYEELFENEYEI